MERNASLKRPHPNSPAGQVEKAATVPHPETGMNKGFFFSSKGQMILPPSPKMAPTWRSAFLTYIPLSVQCFHQLHGKIGGGGLELSPQGTLRVSGRNHVQGGAWSFLCA